MLGMTATTAYWGVIFNLCLYMFAWWGFCWALRKLICPFLRPIFRLFFRIS